MGEGSSVRATRKRAHLAQTVEITRMFSILARGGTLPRAFSNPSRRDSNSEFSIYPLLHVSANATRLRHSRHLDLRSQFSNDEEFAVSGFRLLRRLIRFIISFFLFLLSPSSFISLMKRREKGIKYSLVVFPHAHRCSRMKITITSLCSRIVRITRQL